MKSIIVALLIIIGQSSIANERYMVELNNTGSDMVLSDSEISFIGLALDEYLLESYSSLRGFKADYLCEEFLDSDIVICNFQMNLEGSHSVITLQYDRVTDDVMID